MATKKKSSTAKKNTAKSSKKSTVAAKSKSKTTTAKPSLDTKKVSEVKEERAVAAEKASEVSASKPVVKVSKNANLSKKELALKKLNGWNWIFALMYAAQAAALVFYADKAYRGITSSYLTKDSIAGNDYPVYAQAVRHLMDLNMAYVLAAILGAYGLMHLFTALVLRKKYESDLDRQRNSLRWIGAGVGSAIMIAAVAILVGVSDISLLLMLMASVAFGVINSSVDTSREMCDLRAYVKKSTLLSTVTTLAWLVPWIAIGLYMVGSEKYGSGVQAYIYGLFATAFFGTTLQMLYLNRKNNKQDSAEVDYANVDWTYSVLSLLVTAAFVWQIFFAIMK